MIRLCSISELSKYSRSVSDLNFMIVRNYKDPIANVQQFDRLAPSQELYSFAMNNKHKDGFFELYHKVFKEELLSNEKQVGLAIIEDLYKQGYEINLLCYCKDSNECHRKDVYEALVTRGIECELY